MRIISRFDTEPGPDAPFMYHRHIFDHEDAGTMGQYTMAPPTDNEAATDR